MAVFFAASSPSTLLRAFKEAIDDCEIDTWKYNKDGDFYHTDKQFKGQAWFRPRLSGRVLTFNIVRPKGGKIKSFVYAYYHGHLIETFLYHFDSMSTKATATALAATGDAV